MGRTACTESQCQYKGDLYLYLTLQATSSVLGYFRYRRNNFLSSRITWSAKDKSRADSNGGYLKRLWYKMTPRHFVQINTITTSCKNSHPYYIVSFKEKIKIFGLSRNVYVQKIPESSVCISYTCICYFYFLRTSHSSRSLLTDGSSRLFALFCNYRTVGASSSSPYGRCQLFWCL